MNRAFVIGSLHPARVQGLLSSLPPRVLVDVQPNEPPFAGFAATYNRLVNLAFNSGAEVVWLLNDDIDVSSVDWEICESRFEDETVGAVFPVEAWVKEHGRLISDPIVTQMPFTGEERRIYKALSPEPIEQCFAGFACVAVRKEAWQRVGPMDESLGLGYCEDFDWGLRCWRAGFRILNERSTWFLHEQGGTFGELVKRGLYDPEDPSRAAERLKAKWSELVELWPEGVEPQEQGERLLATLKGWHKEEIL